MPANASVVLNVAPMIDDLTPVEPLPCPQCMRDTAGASECPSCGLVISKFRASSEHPSRLRLTPAWNNLQPLDDVFRIWSGTVAFVSALVCAGQVYLSVLVSDGDRSALFHTPATRIAIDLCLVLACSPFFFSRRDISLRAVPFFASVGLWAVFFVRGLWTYLNAILDGSDYFDLLLLIPSALLLYATGQCFAVLRNSHRAANAPVSRDGPA